VYYVSYVKTFEIHLPWKNYLPFCLAIDYVVNWYQHYWDDFPNPSTKIMNVINVLLEYWDNDLYTHLMSCNIKIQVICISMLVGLLLFIVIKDRLF
jgi:hypothetical protein